MPVWLQHEPESEAKLTNREKPELEFHLRNTAQIQLNCQMTDLVKRDSSLEGPVPDSQHDVVVTRLLQQVMYLAEHSPCCKMLTKNLETHLT